jgi:hypothetical protein
MDPLSCFGEIWLVDFEFSQPSGERPRPLCLVAREYRSGRLLRLWRDELTALTKPPYPIDPGAVFVAYYASAEFGCHLALNWPLPSRILDLYAESRCLTSGLTVPCGHGLLGALSCFGLDGIEAAEKDSMRQLALRGGPYTADERLALLDYCQTDVAALARLLPAMLAKIDLPRALLRGRYMGAAARMEWAGVPIDTKALTSLRGNWSAIQGRLIWRIDRNYGVFDGRTFKADRWAAWLAQNGIPWPRLPSGSLALDDETFRQMARSFPRVAPIRELRASLSQLRLQELAVGADGRNRCLLSAFGARTGRNQPSNAKFIFGPSAWLRSLIKPPPGMALAYVDYEQQEFGIGAALSGDDAMCRAYQSGDPYLTFAKQAGAVPRDATKHTHKAKRDRFKVCALAVQYRMGAEALARKLDEVPARGRELLRLHKETYPKYCRWSDAIRDCAELHRALQSTFGWMVQVGGEGNPRSLRNFPLQANGAEMLRIACCLATERGVQVCAPVHDALLLEAPLANIDDAVAGCQRAMREASEAVLAGFPLRTETKIVRHRDRYTDARGEEMWKAVWELIGSAPGTGVA